MSENGKYFVAEHSVVREIWGKSDTILFIFAGAAAEFALNKSVDWLYFTGKLPKDPIGRLFSTVAYARAIVFSERKAALRAIDALAAIHAGVEARRGFKIPDWAYRDVLFMLIDYSMRAFELMERPLLQNEKEEVFEVFQEVGTRMGVKGLPASLEEWYVMRREQLTQNLEYSHFTIDLFNQYRKHLGSLRYAILCDVQAMLVPATVKKLLSLRSNPLLKPSISAYKFTRRIKLDTALKSMLLPAKYRQQIFALDYQKVASARPSNSAEQSSATPVDLSTKGKCPFSRLSKRTAIDSHNGC